MSKSQTNRPIARNPYDEADQSVLHAAWKDGFEASRKGKPAPSQHEYTNSEVANVWVDGYTAAELAQPADQRARTSSTEGANQLVEVVIIDDHPAIRKAVSDALDATSDVDICGSATTLEEGVRIMEERRPDVGIVDISLADGHGLDLIRSVRERVPDVKMIVFSVYDEKIYAERALRAGASGYVMKTKSLDRLVDAIRNVQRGKVEISPETEARIMERIDGNGSGPGFALDGLTGRERQVFQMLGRGRTVDEIRTSLGVTRKAIETYRRRAKKKLGLGSVSELLQYAIQWTHAQGMGEPLPRAERSSAEDARG